MSKRNSQGTPFIYPFIYTKTPLPKNDMASIKDDFSFYLTQQRPLRQRHCREAFTKEKIKIENRGSKSGLRMAQAQLLEFQLKAIVPVQKTGISRARKK